MSEYKVYEISEDCFSFGVFYNGELLAGSTPKYYKTRAGAERAMKRKAGN